MRGLSRAVDALLGSWEDLDLSPAQRHGVRRLRRFAAAWDRAEPERRAKGLAILGDAVGGVIDATSRNTPARVGLPDLPGTPPAETPGPAPRRRRQGPLARANKDSDAERVGAEPQVDGTHTSGTSGAPRVEETPGVGLGAPITSLKGVGRVHGDALHRAGVRTVEDLLHRLPRDFLDRRARTPVSTLESGAQAVVEGRIDAVRSGRARGSFEVMVDDGYGRLLCRWFKTPPWLKEQLRVGERILVCGRVERDPRPGSAPVLVHPEIERGGAQDCPSVHHGAVIPRYAAVDGLGPRLYRTFIHRAFDVAAPLPDPIPDDLLALLKLPRRAEALRALHFPRDEDDVGALRDGSHVAYRALWAADLLTLQLALAERRRRLGPPPTLAGPPDSFDARLRQALPFEPTPGQHEAIIALSAELDGPRPMQRLLLGDVGSGKTLVATCIAAEVAARGGQVAILAPTEVLARQWYSRIAPVLGTLSLSHGLVLGAMSTKDRAPAVRGAAEGTLDVLVGTHALAAQGVRFARLALLVVDEQQRFGVMDRARVAGKGVEPHLLAMTATPIPRTLALALYGDLDLQRLPDRPGRPTIRTTLHPLATAERRWAELARAVSVGGRAFVVCPRIEGADDDESAVLPLAETLAAGPLAGVPLAVLHGGMNSEEKDRALTLFRNGTARVLVATTVVEVGVDVPEADTMLVVEADRLGLSQLHQLRGRVGRGDREGHCILLHRGPADRLTVLTETRDGFRIAEADLATRGAGDLLGLRQSGDPTLRVLQDERAADLVAGCAALVEALKDDPRWAGPWSALRSLAIQRMERATAAMAG